MASEIIQNKLFLMLGSETDVKCTRAEEKQYSEEFY